MSDSDSYLVRKEACPKCGSRDNLARYSDGHAFCFGMGCDHFEPADGETPRTQRRTMSADFLRGDVRDLVKRGIFADTCAKYGYRVGTDSKGRTVQIADYRDLTGALVGQKVRCADKTFYVVGDLGADAPLYGMHLFRDKGKRVMVTEGEIDALSLGQAMGTWPVVSVPKGAGGAKAAVQRNLEWLEGFDEVVFCLDMDDPGRKAMRECAAVLSPGKAKLWEIPLKDANEMLVAKRVKELTNAIYDAKTFRPGGIVNGRDLWMAMRKRVTTPGTPYPWAGLTKRTNGAYPASITSWVSGTGMGKSTAVAWAAYDRLMAGETVGYVALEEDNGKTAERFVSMHLKQRLDILPPGEVPEDMQLQAFEATLGTGRLWVYDHFGSMEDDDLLAKIRYLIKGCGCTRIVLDHLSIVVSGMDGDGDERKTIDRVMTRLRSLMQETGAVMDLVCHLKRVGGEAKSHEEGGRITLGHLRGSQAIAQLSDTVIALERNQQADDEADRATAICRVLKCRITGWTGVACKLRYDTTTGEMREVDDEEGFQDESKGGDADDDVPF